MVVYVRREKGSNAPSPLLLINKDVLVRVFSIQPHIFVCTNALTLNEYYVISLFS